MMGPEIEIIIIASLVAIACAIPGVFLVLRKMSLMSDAIGHSILLGIILSFFIIKDVSSPLLIIGAALTGVLTVTMTEIIINTGKLKEDASIGLVFPFLFSIGVILITKYAGSVHIDTDAVLLGELAFAPFHRAEFFSIDLPVSIWIVSAILFVNVLFVLLFYKELKIATFDPGLATALGFSPQLLHYALMTLVSITTVGAFDSVGAVLVVALMIAPPATAYLLTNDLLFMILLSSFFGILSAVSGYFVANYFNASIAGSIAMMTGVFFFLAFLFSTSHGIIFKALYHHKRKHLFATQMLIVHLSLHQGKPEEKIENTISNSMKHLNWSESFTKKSVDLGLKKKWMTKKGNQLSLTKEGKQVAIEVMTTTKLIEE